MNPDNLKYTDLCFTISVLRKILGGWWPLNSRLSVISGLRFSYSLPLWLLSTVLREQVHYPLIKLYKICLQQIQKAVAINTEEVKLATGETRMTWWVFWQMFLFRRFSKILMEGVLHWNRAYEEIKAIVLAMLTKFLEEYKLISSFR